MNEQSIETKLALIIERQETLQQSIESIAAILKSLDAKYVKREEFWPVRSLVYGFVVVILWAVAGALVALVVQHGGL